MYLAFTVAVRLAWLKGGQPERFGAGVLMLNELVIMNPAISWRIGERWLAGEVPVFRVDRKWTRQTV